MLTEKLLATETDEAVRRDILFKQMDDAFATILRQIYFAMFERDAHALIMKNASVYDLCAAYMENLKEQFGDSLELTDDFKWEWVSIPHIYHTPFYVYAYAFGDCLVNALYAVFQGGHPGFQAKYLDMLRAGGTKRHKELLAPFGLDASDPAFWTKGLDVVSGFIDELEKAG